ncbi:PAS sensor protein [Salinisphaera sp. T31B1]
MSGRAPAGYVALGGSAGSLKVFQQFFDAVCTDTGLVFVVVAHMAPDQESHLLELIASHTTMPVSQVDDALVAAPDHVYVISPNQHLTIDRGWLRPTTISQNLGARFAIHRFFVSLAHDQGDRAVGILVSGSGRDGRDGMAAIRAAGGLTIAQSPEEATHPDMPAAAIRSGHVDQVLPVAGMPAAIDAFFGPDTGREPVVDTPEEHDPASPYRAIVNLLSRRHGHDFSHYKPGTLTRRIGRRIGIRRVDSFDAYLSLLESDETESQQLLQDLLISVTGFFRDPEAYEALEQQLVPDLIGRSGRDGKDSLRLWVAGCATGEEAYSLAIVMLEALDAYPSETRASVSVYATDIDSQALEVARSGCYSETIAADMSDERLARWFTATEPGYRVNKTLRDTVMFAPQNLLSDPPFSRMDLVSCRNVLIYLDKATQRRLLEMFHFALKPEGWLLLGNSETAHTDSGLFHPRSHKHRLYTRTAAHGSAGRHLGWITPTQLGRRDLPRNQTDLADMNRHQLSKTVQRLLLNEYAPTSVVTNAAFDLIYIHGDSSGYLSLGQGVPSDNLLRLARRGLRGAVQDLVNVALQQRQAHSVAARVQRHRHYVPVRMRARPFRLNDSGDEFVVVSFVEIDGSVGEQSDASTPTPHDEVVDVDERIAQLEYELRLAHDEHQRAADELQSTREEFRSAHEEALSINEELQSANEELESSKEELQSLNEELSTVNTELQEKMHELEDTHDDIANLLDSTAIPTVFLDGENRIKRFTPATKMLLSVLPSDIGRPIDDLAHPFQRALDWAGEAAAVRNSGEISEIETETADGQWYIRRTTPYRARDGQMRGVVVSFIDVTRLKQAERALAHSDQTLQTLFHENPAMYFILDEHDRIVSVNEFGAFQLGYEAEQLVGASFADMHRRPSMLHAKLARCQARPGKLQRWEVEIRGRNGKPLWIRANARLTSELDEGIRILVSCENISREKRLGEQAKYHATHDALTDLINRRAFKQVISAAIDQAALQDKTHMLGYIDLDSFKIINDSYGHQAGDELLRQASQCMYASLRQGDVLARIGGDEFAVLMYDCDGEQAKAAAHRMIESLHGCVFLWQRHHLRVGASIGLASIDREAGSVEAVMQAADAACFAAKELGPNSIHRQVANDRRVTRRRRQMNWANRIREALADNRILMHVQPIVSVHQADEIHGYESLLRLRDTDGEIVAAHEFIDAAEHYGLIHDLDRFALSHTLRFLDEHRHRLRAFQWIGINLSATSLTHPGFLTFARKVLSDSGIDAQRVCFEITETSVISNLSQAQHFIREMSELGCTFALDDFGTGLSSFEYLRVLPVEYVKIDGSFIRDIRHDPADRAMVEAVTHIAHMMGKTAIAESVETAELLHAVRGMNIEYAQGHHFGKPDALESLLVSE